MTNPYVARSPEDLIALAPTVLGFEPADSVLVMTFGRPGRAFHARVDLPRRPQDQDDVADTILRAMRGNHLRECAVLIYSDDRDVATSQARTLERALRRARIRVVDVLLVTGDRFFRVLRDDKRGTAFDVSSHPFTARRVLEGHVVHGSRAELAATLIADPEARAAWSSIEISAEEWAVTPADVAAEAAWIQALIRDALPTGTVPDAELSRLLAALRRPALSDVAWAMVDHASAEAHVELWRNTVRRAPDAYIGAPACLLAFAAWLAGDGALAWCALDRADCADLPMARMLSELLDAAVSPALWPRLSADELSALRGPAA